MMKPEAKPARMRTCARCGQPINTQTDSWEMKQSEDGKYATGIQHVTCPASPEMQNLPTVPQTPQDGSGETAPAPHALPMGSPEYITMDEAGALIRVSKQTIRKYIKSGILPAKRLRGGQTVLVDKRDVLALLEDIPQGTDIG